MSEENVIKVQTVRGSDLRQMSTITFRQWKEQEHQLQLNAWYNDISTSGFGERVVFTNAVTNRKWTADIHDYVLWINNTHPDRERTMMVGEIKNNPEVPQLFVR